jgi:hypothetical protein
MGGMKNMPGMGKKGIMGIAKNAFSSLSFLLPVTLMSPIPITQKNPAARKPPDFF